MKIMNAVGILVMLSTCVVGCTIIVPKPNEYVALGHDGQHHCGRAIGSGVVLIQKECSDGRENQTKL